MVSQLVFDFKLGLLVEGKIDIVNQLFDVVRECVFCSLLETHPGFDEGLGQGKMEWTFDLFEEEDVFDCEEVFAEGSIKILKNSVCNL